MSGGTEEVLSPHIRDAQIEETAKAVEAAMRDASIEALRDVHFVPDQMPLLTSERVQDAAERGKIVVTASGYASMGYSRGAPPSASPKRWVRSAPRSANARY